MADSKKGHKLFIVRLIEKAFRLFFVLMLSIKFQVPSSSSSQVLHPTKGVTDRQRTDILICPLNLFEVGSKKKTIINSNADSQKAQHKLISFHL